MNSSTSSDAEEELELETDPSSHLLQPLSNTDRDFFLQLLENPPEPNAAFLEGAKRYKARHARDAE